MLHLVPNDQRKGNVMRNTGRSGILGLVGAISLAVLGCTDGLPPAEESGDSPGFDVTAEGPAAGGKLGGQYWDYEPGQEIHAAYSGMCLDAQNNGTGNGTPIVMWPCNGGANQKWVFRNIGRDRTGSQDRMVIQGVQSGKCIDNAGGNTGTPNTHQLILWDCGWGSNINQWYWSNNQPGGNHQLWTYGCTGGGLRSTAGCDGTDSGYGDPTYMTFCVNRAGGGNYAGQPVIAYTDGPFFYHCDHENELWYWL